MKQRKESGMHALCAHDGLSASSRCGRGSPASGPESGRQSSPKFSAPKPKLTHTEGKRTNPRCINCCCILPQHVAAMLKQLGQRLAAFSCNSQAEALGGWSRITCASFSGTSKLRSNSYPCHPEITIRPLVSFCDTQIVLSQLFEVMWVLSCHQGSPEEQHIQHVISAQISLIMVVAWPPGLFLARSQPMHYQSASDLFTHVGALSLGWQGIARLLHVFTSRYSPAPRLLYLCKPL